MFLSWEWMMFRRYISGLLITAVGVTCSVAVGGTVILNNGDHISGRITQLTQRRVVVNTSYAGGVVIKLSSVQTLISSQPVKLTGANGKISLVTLSPAPGNQGWITHRVAVTTQAKAIPADLPPLPLVKPVPVSIFGPDWANELDLGATNTTGNSNSTLFNGAISFHYRHRPDNLLIAFNGGYGVTNGSQSLGFFSSNVLWKRQLNEFKPKWAKRVFLFLQSTNLYDAIQGISIRSDTEGGLGYYLWDNKKSEFDLRAGPGYTYERLFHGQSYSYINGIAALHYRYQIAKHIKFTQTAGYVSSLQNAYNYQLNATSALYMGMPQIACGLGLRFSFTDLYDNTAGTQDLKRNSTLILAALTLKF
jgi:putative salt-induced outer membrane protein YdiY